MPKKWFPVFSGPWRWVGFLILFGMLWGWTGRALAAFAELETVDTPSGYLARLLINEVPFPGEWAYKSEADSKTAMYQILWVLHSRIHYIPQGYTQWEIAGVQSENIIDVITGAGGHRQCQGFYQDAQGKFVTEPRVEARIQDLLNIANSGGRPGRFAGLINYAQELAGAYFKEGIEGVDRYARLTRIGNIPVTGRAYAWMTDVNNYHPGGNFVTITDAYDGDFGGNRFFSLRKLAK